MSRRHFSPSLLDGYPEHECEDDAPTKGATCKRCGRRGLEWVDCGGNPARWKLFEGNAQHICSQETLRRETADDFEALS